MIIENRPVVQEGEPGWAGRDVILYNVVHPINLPVARATVQKTNPSDTVQDEPLGPGCREVVVNFVLKKNAVLPRPYGNVVTMSDACGKSIAWPLSRMKDDKKVA